MNKDGISRKLDFVFGLSPSAHQKSLPQEAIDETTAPEATIPLDAILPRAIHRNFFSPFLKADAARAADLASELGQLADRNIRDVALEKVVERAAEVAEDDPLLAQHAIGLFSTHHPLGPELTLPSLLRRTAETAALRAPVTDITLGSSSTGEEARLDWFREDPLANEHHEHWHLVYPNRVEAAEIKERHGELFYYMHQQMLARYDTERVAAGLPTVVALSDLKGSLGEGYDPGRLTVNGIAYNPRPANASMKDLDESNTVDDLARYDSNLQSAARNQALGNAPDVTQLSGHAGSDLLGHEAESTNRAAHDALYSNHHGMGHGLIGAANLSETAAPVMFFPATAIRDPVFWRWHRHVDDIHFGYQDALEPHEFDDPKTVLLESIGIKRSDDGSVVDELTTEMRSGRYTLSDRQVYHYEFLMHEPFSISARLKNTSGAPAPVTLRTFLIPSDLFDVDADPTTAKGRQMRRFVIELDKVKIDVPAGDMTLERKDVDSSVIRRPAVTDPSEVEDQLGQSGTAECTCGWPYGLLVPRGSATGMLFTLFAMITDNLTDRVGSPKKCGSMSFCGVGDKYPDARPMGYPFDRPLKQPLSQIVAQNANMAISNLTIRFSVPSS
jgi:tyrosinase|nr:tyrosinase family protein [Neorhizobium tomejilense]